LEKEEKELELGVELTTEQLIEVAKKAKKLPDPLAVTIAKRFGWTVEEAEEELQEWGL
jgi:hypothetical protein